MDKELVAAIVSLKGRDDWEAVKAFIKGERDMSLHDFGNLDIVEKPQLLAHLSGMIAQADRILRVIDESEASVN